MKTIVLTGIFAICFVFIYSTSYAQKNQKATSKASSKTSLQYCDKAVATAQKNNQLRANNECQTVHECVPCLDKKSKKETCKSVTVQPVKGNCNTVATVIKTAESEASRTNKKAPTFKAEIFQTPCGTNSVTLEAVVVADGQASYDAKSKAAYTYHWEVDGKASGTDSQISCVTGKEATVKVTKTATSEGITLYIKPPSAISNPAPAAAAAAAVPVEVPTIAAIYKKTGCFGLCPIYEVQFYTDGRVRWEGKMNTGTPGFKEAKMDRETLAQIERIAEKVNFYKMDNRYPDYQVWDAPSTVIYLGMNGREKQVVDIIGAPEELNELKRFFDDYITKNGWRTSPDKKTTKTGQGASNGND